MLDDLFVVGEKFLWKTHRSASPAGLLASTLSAMAGFRADIWLAAHVDDVSGRDNLRAAIHLYDQPALAVDGNGPAVPLSAADPRHDDPLTQRQAPGAIVQCQLTRLCVAVGRLPAQVSLPKLRQHGQQQRRA